MRIQLSLFVVTALALTACGETRDVEEPGAAPDVAARGEAEDTGVNVRDRGGETQTPFDQSNDERDLALTRQIRQQIVEGDFSTNAENVKVVTEQGVVTLRGPVENEAERQAIVEIARGAGAARVDDQLEVARN